MQTFTLDPTAIGFHVDVDATVRDAQHAGRHGNLVARVTGTVLRRVRADDVPLVVRYDTRALDDILDAWGTKVDHGIVEGGLEFHGTDVVAVAPHARAPESSATKRAGASSTRSRTGTGPRRCRSRSARSGPTSIRRTSMRLRRAPAGCCRRASRSRPLNADATIATGATRKRCSGHTRHRRRPRPDDRHHEAAPCGRGAPRRSSRQPAIDATFAISAATPCRSFRRRTVARSTSTRPPPTILRGDRVVVAGAKKVHPAHDTAWARKLGITRQVSSFTTYHAPGEARVHNIHLAADVLNNTVVEPGQTFSLNDKLGPRTPEKGYVKAPILVSDGFGEDYGGGISQLTTTLYNAVFFGGYADVDHSPHHFYISRYPMGREATINYPSVDLKFRNDTSHGVLIRTYYSDTSITVAFYGDNDGRTVREENRKILHTEPITEQARELPGEGADRRPEQQVRDAHRVPTKPSQSPARRDTTSSSTA